MVTVTETNITRYSKSYSGTFLPFVWDASHVTYPASRRSARDARALRQSCRMSQTSLPAAADRPSIRRQRRQHGDFCLESTLHRPTDSGVRARYCIHDSIFILKTQALYYHRHDRRRLLQMNTVAFEVTMQIACILYTSSKSWKSKDIFLVSFNKIHCCFSPLIDLVLT